MKRMIWGDDVYWLVLLTDIPQITILDLNYKDGIAAGVSDIPI